MPRKYLTVALDFIIILKMLKRIYKIISTKEESRAMYFKDILYVLRSVQSPIEALQ